MTYRYVAYDIQKNLYASYDDADFTINQVLYWVAVFANKLRLQHQLATNSDLFTSTFSSVKVHEDSKSRKYIDLPVQVMDLPNNGGVIYITYNEETCGCAGPAFAQVWFQGTSVGSVQNLYMDEYTTPSSKNPYFYRVGHRADSVDVNRLYLLGLECVKVEDVEIAVKSSIDPRQICDLDAELPLPDALVQDLITAVLQLGKFIMMVPEETTNDGADTTEPSTALYANRAANLPKNTQQQQQ
jgi:hypothetical protein